MMKHGYQFLDEGVSLNVWAPLIREMEVYNISSGKRTPMFDSENGFKNAVVRLDPGEKYYLVADGRKIPDPASRFQPDGIYGPSEIVQLKAPRVKRWKTYDLKNSVIEEVHIGTFSKEGTYESAARMIREIIDVGVNSVELMPLNQTYGTRNWGYDGVFLYAPNYTYGRPEQLQAFIDLLHENDVNVFLDVVYNHVGPLGDVLGFLGYYFSETYRNPWGRPFNFDGYGSDPVRSFILQNVEYWIAEYNFDGLRLDATHAIIDSSPTSILKDISILVRDIEKKLHRKIKLIAENDRNDTSLVRGFPECGFAFDGVWNDDLHHSLHSYITGEHGGYYSDYGNISDVADCYRNGFLYNGRYSAYLNRVRGTPFDESKWKLIVFDSNHDQVGNRAFGERPVTILGDNKAKLLAASVILSPFTPMLFMGEEYGETRPFLFFVQTDDEDFASKVREGRKSEFKDFEWSGKLPDPSSIDTFNSSKLSWDINGRRGRDFRAFYKKMIQLRRRFVTPNCGVTLGDNVITLEYDKVNVYLSFSEGQHEIRGAPIYPEGAKLLGPFGVVVTRRG